MDGHGQSDEPLPARIIQVWDSAFVHVDYRAYGNTRLDEVVEASRLSRVVKFAPVPQQPANGAAHSLKQADEEVSLPSNPAGSTAPDNPVQQDMPRENESWKEYKEDFKKMRSIQVLDHKQQELQRLQVCYSWAPPRVDCHLCLRVLSFESAAPPPLSCPGCLYPRCCHGVCQLSQARYCVCSLGCHLQAALEQQKQALQQAVRLNFAVDDDLLGLVVGAKVLSLALYIFVASARQLPAFPALPCNIVSATLSPQPAAAAC